MGSEQGHSHLHPDHYVLLENAVNYGNQMIPPVLPAPGNASDLHLQFTDPYRTNYVHGSHFNGMQYCPSVSSNYVGEVAPANFYDPHMPSSSNGLAESRSSAISFQPVPPFSYHYNYYFQRNQMDQSFQPSRNAFRELFGGYVNDGRYSNQYCSDAKTYMHDFLLVTKVGSSTESSLCSRDNGTLITSMAHMEYNHQMLDMGPEQGPGHLHPNLYILLGNSVNYRNQCMPPILPAPGNSADLHLQLTDPYRTNCVHGSHFNGMQYCQSISSNYVGEVAPANFYDPHMPSSSNGLVNSGSSAISFQPVSPFPCHYGHFLQRNQVDLFFQPSRNAFMELFDDGRYCNQSYTDATTYVHGHLEVADMGIQGHQGNSSNRCTAFNMHHPSFSNNFEPVQNLQIDVYSHHTQIPAAPNWHPFDNLHTNNVYPLTDDQISGFKFVGPMPSTSGQMYIPPIFEAVPRSSYDPINPPFEDFAELMEAAEFYDSEDAFDQYSDMRMDIDDMSYEELMDLEEKIGDVKTGLSEEFILKNLRTSMHVQQSTSSSLVSASQSASENGICIVCQVVYEENEMIGTLNCSHSYHADCIKQWLAVKNVCPICKSPALVA